MKKATLSLSTLVLSIFLLSLQLRADSVLTTITVGNGASGIAANPKTNKIYVGDSGQVVVIDGKTQKVTDRITIDTGNNANFIAVNVLTNRIYATACNSGACKIAVIDGRNNKVITDIPIASGDAVGNGDIGNHLVISPVDDGDLARARITCGGIDAVCQHIYGNEICVVASIDRDSVCDLLRLAVDHYHLSAVPNINFVCLR